MELEHLIQHPEEMDKETLYDLRSLLALHPYYQTARLLMLQNLYLLHDTTFDEELRRAAIYITDRKTVFNLVEAAHYSIRSTHRASAAPSDAASKDEEDGSRTLSLIDQFLESLPEDGQNEDEKRKRKMPSASPTTDYIAYLLETEEANAGAADDTAAMNRQDLIDNFINNDKGKIELKEIPEYLPQLKETDKSEINEGDEGYFTETLARIYIKQGRYLKALEIIKRLNLNYPKKNAYFADQIRFLEKLIINNNKK